MFRAERIAEQSLKFGTLYNVQLKHLRDDVNDNIHFGGAQNERLFYR